MTNEEQKPVGELYSRAYLERGAALHDNQFFRNRLDGYLTKNHFKEWSDIASYLKVEAGLIVEAGLVQPHGVYYNFPKFFTETRVEYVLSAVTLIWRYLRNAHPVQKKIPSRSGMSPLDYYIEYPHADAWLKFVQGALREENMAYTVDEKCGVHHYVDEEFQRNRHSALKALEAPRYAGARVAFEDAFRHFDLQPADTKSAVRSAFEAVEIVARLILPDAKNLNRWMVENRLKTLAVQAAKDEHEADAMNKIFDGVAQWVDGLHYYRHGQGVERAVAPTLTLTVYAISTAAAVLRWLVELDIQKRGHSA